VMYRNAIGRSAGHSIRSIHTRYVPAQTLIPPSAIAERRMVSGACRKLRSLQTVSIVLNTKLQPNWSIRNNLTAEGCEKARYSLQRCPRHAPQQGG